ncbi:MAG: FGGY family carbohydrate kinase [Armatimonadota bacterium]|nr:FGGY family carbohydrate kinase [Armatimonadota bacterium]
MSASAYLGLDLGGTGAKAGVYDQSGKLLGFGRAACEPSVYSDGRVEVPIEDVYKAARKAARQAIAESGAEIRALAISSQGQTFVSLDANDQPLHPAIIWYDSRASEQAIRMREKVVSSNPMPVIEAIATAPKIMWLKEHYPELMSRARRYLLLPDYFNYRLTGIAATDPSTATSTALYADDATDYSSEALAAVEIYESSLARIQPSGSAVGCVRPEAASDWGLSENTLVVIGSNDQYAGALGAGNCRPGIISETTGTCLALVTLTEKRIEPVDGLWIGRFPITRYQFGLAYAKTAGVVLDWFNRQFCPDKDLRDLDEIAAVSPIGANGITVLPHFDGMVSPKPNPESKGFIGNLTLSHTAGDIYRGILESLSFSLRENIEFVRKAGFDAEVVRAIGGGAKSDFWLQMKADVIGLPVERPSVSEAATLGAAMLAVVGAGEYESLQDSSETLYRAVRIFEPNEESRELYEKPFNNYRNLCRRAYDPS